MKNYRYFLDKNGWWYIQFRYLFFWKLVRHADGFVFKFQTETDCIGYIRDRIKSEKQNKKYKRQYKYVSPELLRDLV